MGKEIKSIDISNLPELVRLAEEVNTTNEPRLLKCDNKDIAILSPVKPAKKRTRTKTDHEAFLSSAGSWKGIIDADKFIADIYESRKRSSRPPVRL